MSLTVHSFGTFIFQTPPLALLSSSLYAKQQATLHDIISKSLEYYDIMNTNSTCKFNSPEGLSFTSHQMIATSQWQAGDTRYVIVNSPEVLCQFQGEERKQVILLNHLTGTASQFAL